METWSRFCHLFEKKLFPRKMDSFVGANEYPAFLVTFASFSRFLKNQNTICINVLLFFWKDQVSQTDIVLKDVFS